MLKKVEIVIGISNVALLWPQMLKFPVSASAIATSVTERLSEHSGLHSRNVLPPMHGCSRCNFFRTCTRNGDTPGGNFTPLPGGYERV